MRTTVKNAEETISREELATQIIGAFDEAMKIMKGELPRPKTNWDETFKEWNKLAEEVKNGR